MKKIRKLTIALLVVAVVALLAGTAGAAVITFVDPVEGSSGNTYETGGSLSDTSWMEDDDGSASTDAGGTGVWEKRTGNNGASFEGALNGFSDPELTTEVSGLDVNKRYNAWVFFQDATGSNKWNIQAGLSSGSLTTYSHDGLGDTASPVSASSLSFDGTVDTDRMYGVNLGFVRNLLRSYLPSSLCSHPFAWNFRKSEE